MEKKRKETVEVEPSSKKQKSDNPLECMLVADNRERITIGEEIMPFIMILRRQQKWERGQLGTAQLPLGDFIFTQEIGIRGILERKTIRDLIASIGDKRFEEQKTRLIQAKREGPETMVGLVVEGALAETDIGQYNAQHVQNLLWEMSKFNLQVVLTKNLDETLKYLSYMRWSFSRENGMSDAQNTQMLSMAGYSSKKKGMTPKDTYPKMLKSIPGISTGHVEAIVEEFPKLTDLIRAFEDKPDLFDGFHLTESKKMGIVMSKKLHKFLFNTGEEI